MVDLKNIFKIFGKKSVNNSDERWWNDGSGSIGQSSKYYKGPRDYLNAFQFVAYVGQASDIIAKDIASLKYSIQNNNGDPVENQDIFSLLSNPNKLLTWQKFIKKIALHLLLDGNAFVFPDYKTKYDQLKGRAGELIILNPSLVDVCSGFGGIIRSQTHYNGIDLSGYNINYENRYMKVGPELMAHFALVSPYNDLRGMGVVQRSSSDLDQSALQNIFNRAFFANGAVSTINITAPYEMGPVEFQEYKDRVRKENGGIENLKKIMVTPFGTKAEPLNINHKDMEFLEQKKMTREDIFGGMFQIPPVRSGIMADAKYDSAEEQMNVYYDDTLPGYYRTIEATLTNIISTIDPRAIFKFVPKQFQNIEKISKVCSVAFKDGIITGNEYRAKLGIENGEQLHLEKMYMDMNRIEAGTSPIQQTVESEEKKSVEQTDEKARPPRANEKPASKKAIKVHKLGIKLKEKNFTRFKSSQIKYYKGFEARVLKGLEKSITAHDTKSLDINELIDFENEVTEAKKSANPVYTSMIAQSLNAQNELFEQSIDISFKNPKIRLAVDKLGIRYANETVESRKKELTDILNDILEEGQGVTEATARIKDYFEELNNPSEAWKADRIARTEITRAYDQASNISYEELGVKMVQVVGCTKKWVGWDCDTDGSRGTYPMSMADSLSFHPNHTGSIVPVIE